LVRCVDLSSVVRQILRPFFLCQIRGPPGPRCLSRWVAVGQGDGASGRNPWLVATTTVTATGITPSLEAPSRIPSLQSFHVGPGENHIPRGMGGDYASGVVSFLKALFWVKGATCGWSNSVGSGGWFLLPRLPSFLRRGFHFSMCCCSVSWHQKLASDQMSPLGRRWSWSRGDLGHSWWSGGLCSLVSLSLSSVRALG
jgi:hypothetical protein